MPSATEKEIAVAFLQGRYQVLRQLLTSPRMNKPQREVIRELAFSTIDKLKTLGVESREDSDAR